MPKFLKIVQANVGHIPSAQEAVLNCAAKEGAKVIILQEPYYNSSNRTITHPQYRTLKSPKSDTPRAITLLHNNTKGYISRTRPVPEVLDVYLPEHQLTITNVYRPPHSPRDSPIHQEIINLR